MMGALAGQKVIDASQGVAGPYAARLLGDLGAAVIKIEPPAGDSSRRLGPFPPAGADPERGGLFLYLNWNKRSAVLDLDCERDRQHFRQLVSGADVLIESFPVGYLDGIGLGYPVLAAAHPALIQASVTPFGQTGPYRHWQSDEIVEWAMGGYMYFGGHPDRPPLMIPGYQAQFHAAQEAVVAVLAARWHRRRHGHGQQIDQSIIEAVLSAHSWTSVAWSHQGHVLRRIGSDLMRCQDGWVMFMRRRFERNVFLLIDRPDLLDAPRFEDLQIWLDPASEVWQLVANWCQGRGKQEIYHAAQALRIPVTPVNTMADLLGSGQLKERNWFIELDHPKAGKLIYPGFPYKLSDTPARVDRAAPLLGQDTVAILQEVEAGLAVPAGQKAAAVAPGTPGDDRRQLPLRDIRVVEVTANWAGPLAGRHLADLGAEVIKIEYAQRPATRATWLAGNDPARYPHNRSGYFNKLNRNKLDLCLDLAQPDGRATFLQLIACSDILIENNSVRVMPNLGLSYEVLSRVNPQLVMVSMSGFGATGPDREYIAYGANVEASSGLASVMGYGDAQPFRAGSFYGDPITGTYGAYAALAALHARDATGRGQFIDAALNECAATFFGAALLEYQLTGELPPQRANRHPVFAPQGCYPTMGNDAWLVLTVRNETEWQALCRLLARGDWAADAELATEGGRRLRHDELDAGVTAWVREFDHREAAGLLQAAGIPAAPVLANWELLSDPHLFAREFYVYVPHAEIGVFPFPGLPWKLSRTPGQIRRPAPLFAEHNDVVLQTILGLSEDKITALEAAGITAGEPSPPAA
jgi:crotonobetainyl-CoA:carnitine CoA-transferase CaiB-like acyl-CoA transferase